MRCSGDAFSDQVLVHISPQRGVAQPIEEDESRFAARGFLVHLHQLEIAVDGQLRAARRQAGARHKSLDALGVVPAQAARAH